MNISRSLKKREESYLKAHLYSAAGAFSPQDVQEIMKIWKTKKSMKIIEMYSKVSRLEQS